MIAIELRIAVLTLCLTLSASSPAAIQSAATSQANTDATPESTKPASRPNPDASGIYHIGDGVVAPKLTYRVMPELTEMARRQRIDGSCTVQLIVETNGHVRDVHIVKSVADQYSDEKDREAALTLDQNAIEAVSRYQFQPGTFQGRPVPVELKVAVSYTIRYKNRSLP